MSYQPDQATTYREQQLGLERHEAEAVKMDRFGEPKFFGMGTETFVERVRRLASDELYKDTRIALYQCATMLEQQGFEIARLKQQIAEMGG